MVVSVHRKTPSSLLSQTFLQTDVVPGFVIISQVYRIRKPCQIVMVHYKKDKFYRFTKSFMICFIPFCLIVVKGTLLIANNNSVMPPRKRIIIIVG